MGEACPHKGISLAELGRRPTLSLDRLSVFLPGLEHTEPDILSEAENIIKYAGYIERQRKAADSLNWMEHTSLPPGLDYTGIPGLSVEVQEKLNKIKPQNLGQAGRISGVTPAALDCVLIHLKKGTLQK